VSELINFEKFKTEAKDFGILRLQAETGLSRSHLYSIFNGKVEPTLETAQKILGSLGYFLKIERASKRSICQKGKLKDENYIRWCLAQHGAPLILEKHFNQALDIDETLLKALEVGRQNPDINAILPYFILNNYESLDFDLIIDRTTHLRYFGYLINIVAHYTNDLYLYEIMMD